MPVATASPTYTPSSGAIMGNIQNLTKAVTSQIQVAPAVREQLADQAQQADQFYAPLAQTQGSLVEQMFAMDQQMAQKYAQPESQYYIEDPMARQRISESAKSGLWGAISQTGSMMKQRRDLMGDAIDRGMRLYEAGITAKQQELDSLFKQLDYVSRYETGGVDGELNKMLTLAEAQALGLPYGATRAMAMGRSPMTTDQQNKMNTLNVLEQQFGELVKASEPVMYGRMGHVMLAAARNPLIGAQGVLGLGQRELTNVLSYDSLAEGTISLMARNLFGEKGTMTEGDIARARALTPMVYDTPELRAEKLSRLRRFLDSNWSSLSTTPTEKYASIYSNGGSVNTASYNPMASLGASSLAGDWEVVE